MTPTGDGSLGPIPQDRTRSHADLGGALPPYAPPESAEVATPVPARGGSAEVAPNRFSDRLLASSSTIALIVFIALGVGFGAWAWAWVVFLVPGIVFKLSGRADGNGCG